MIKIVTFDRRNNEWENPLRVLRYREVRCPDTDTALSETEVPLDRQQKVGFQQAWFAAVPE